MQEKRTSVNLDADAMDVALKRIEPDADENSSSLLSAARFTGYHAAALENAIKPATKEIEKKLTISKWIYRIVKWFGVKTSAKLAWKGYKFKSMMDRLTDKKAEPKQIYPVL